MAKRVFIAVGHGGTDPGAVGYVREEDANLTTALEMKRLLEAAGVIVGISRTKDENDPVSEEVKEANAFRPHLATEVHNNAGGGDGFEAWVPTDVYAEESRKAAEAIEKQVKAIGQNSRGIKSKKRDDGKDSLAFLRGVNAPKVVLEGFFVDNKTDAKDFDTVAEQKRLAAAYVAGILTYLEASQPAALSVGDVVTFSGTKHYKSAGAKTGSACKPGAAKITAVSKDAKHPYHLIAEKGGGSTVYGWVDADTVTPAKPWEPAKGNLVNFSGAKHYASSDSDKAYACKPGKAKITATAPGTKHPFHVVAVFGGGSSVYGWVDADTISKA
jgi:hypothetical protein